MEQICLNSPAEIASIIGYVVVGVSTVVNFIPSPDKIKNPVLCVLSRVLHFIAIDISTSLQKKK